MLPRTQRWQRVVPPRRFCRYQQIPGHCKALFSSRSPANSDTGSLVVNMRRKRGVLRRAAVKKAQGHTKCIKIVRLALIEEHILAVLQMRK